MHQNHSLMIKEGKNVLRFLDKNGKFRPWWTEKGLQKSDIQPKKKSYSICKKNLRMHREHPNKCSTYNLCKCYVCIKVDIFQEGHIFDTLFQYFSVKHKLWRSYHDVRAIRWSYGKIWMSAATALYYQRC